MKIINYLVFSLFIICSVSCSSDDDGSSDDNNNPGDVTILGNWNASEYTMSGNFVEDGVTISFTGVANSLPGNNMTLHADHTITGHSEPFMMQLSYVINGAPMTIPQQVSSSMVNEGVWSREGDTLYLEDNEVGETQEFTIDVLNATTLKISGDQSSMSEDGALPPGSIFVYSFTFTR